MYSDVGFITLGALIERLTGQTEAEYVRERILDPLGMDDSGYRPSPALLDRIAATVMPPPTARLRRELIHGVVHDDDAWSLDGVAGHAGMFSTAADLARFAQMILNSGAYGGAQILRPETLAEMTRLQVSSDGNRRGLGFEINERWYMGDLTGPRTIGHTGYTGTSLVIDLGTRTFEILLTNRVHPADNG